MLTNRKTWIGWLLVLFGALLLLEQFNVLRGVPGILWGALLIGLGLALLTDQRHLPGAAAWKVFPSLALIGMGAESMLPKSLSALEGVLFLSAMGASFLLFMRGTKNSWWAVIPAGVFFSLALTNLLDNLSKVDAGGVFLIGLGVTFLVLAIVKIEGVRQEWGYIPGVALIILGGVQYVNKIGISWDILLPGLLIAAGLLFLVRSFTGNRKA